MTENDILTMLKADLDISVTKKDSYLTNLIKLAKAAIEKEGITFGESVQGDEKKEFTVEDGMLVQMYAAYLYRKRREENAVMPRSLRYALNNRLLSQKGSVT